MQENKRAVILGLDSSGPTLTVCASDGEKTHSLYHTGIKQEQFLFPLLERLLAKCGAELKDVSRVFFVRGPGRFTGIRISLTLASMLQHLAGAKVGSASVFEILRRQALESRAFEQWRTRRPDGILAVVWHAFRDEYFLQFFDEKNAGPAWLSKEELLKRLAERTEPVYCAGTDKDGAPLNGLLADKYRIAPLADCRVRPQTLLEMAADSIYEECALEPLYLKPARFELGR